MIPYRLVCDPFLSSLALCRLFLRVFLLLVVGPGYKAYDAASSRIEGCLPRPGSYPLDVLVADYAILSGDMFWAEYDASSRRVFGYTWCLSIGWHTVLVVLLLRLLFLGVLANIWCPRCSFVFRYRYPAMASSVPFRRLVEGVIEGAWVEVAPR